MKKTTIARRPLRLGVAEFNGRVVR